MARLAFRMKLFKGFEKEYKKRHDEIFPELEELLYSIGVEDYAIFLDEETGYLFATIIIEDKKRLKELPQHPVMQKWWVHMKDIMETNADNSPVSVQMKKMFRLKKKGAPKTEEGE